MVGICLKTVIPLVQVPWLHTVMSYGYYTSFYSQLELVFFKRHEQKTENDAISQNISEDEAVKHCIPLQQSILYVTFKLRHGKFVQHI